jgi:hypothetical protein
MILGMRFLPKFGGCDGSAEGAGEVGGPRDADVAGVSGEAMDVVESNLLKTVGWISAALGAVALGLIVGREIRLRYKFNRRTPYDLYSHSGDELPDVDFGVGI